MVGFYGRTYKESAKIPIESFNIWAKKAIGTLNYFTCRDVSQMEDFNVKMCICEVAELLYEQSKRRGIKSENNDGCSVSYDLNCDGEAIGIIKKWLSGSGLLYRGDVL